ncbi:MAG: hypothetical protein JOZ05_11180, partial [Acetobacteraceae bacterium]|nr:hypothetical protein [Acetobacteraceae bacterium]
MLTGPAGTGKSALVQEIARILRYAGWHVTIRIAALQPDGAQRAPGRQQSVLFIDEADRLSMDELERLDAGGAGALVLAGLDEIGARWGAGARVSLSVLTPAEARAYIEQWLTMAGQDLSRFEPSAIERAVELGAGVPRLLSSLLCGTLWMRAANGSERVRREHVEDAAALRFCSREDGAESPEGAGSAAAAPRRDAHLAEQAQAHPAPSEPSPPAELSAELAPTQDARIADSPAAPRRRRVLVPALAASLAVLAAGGAVAVWSWPDETTQSGTVMQASIAELLDRARQSEPVTHPEPPLPERLAIVTPPQSEPPAAAAPLPTESSPPSAPKPTPRLSAAPARTNSTVTEESAPVPAAAQEPASSPPAAVQAESPAEELAVAAPEPPAPVMVKAVSAAEPPAPPQNPVPLSDALVETLVRRGNEMLALGDFSAARLL